MSTRLGRWLAALDRIPAGLTVAFLCLPALAPLARPGFFELHDGTIHLYRLDALTRAVRAGAVYPRWFPEFAFGYGHPVLNFYGPLTYYAALPFTLLGLDAVAALKLLAACSLLASAWGMLLFARLHLDRGPAVVAATVYTYLPYHLLDLYMRGAFAEYLAFAWFPLVLWAFHRLVQAPPARRPARLCLAALLLAALVVTHNLSALLFAPVLGIYVLLLLAAERGGSPLGQQGLVLAAAFALAVCLSAFYWVPVLAESGYVGLGHSVSEGYMLHLLPPSQLLSSSLTYPYPTEPGVVPPFRLGLVQWLILLGAAVALPFRRHLRRWPAVLFLAVALGSAFMLTTTSQPVWQALRPALGYLQYPWRFQSITVLATAFLAGALVQGAARPAPARLALAAALVAATALWALWRLPLTPLRPDLRVEAMWHRDRVFGQVGATWTGEYLPVWVSEQRWALSHPAAEGAPSGGPLPAGQLRLTGTGYTAYRFSVQASEPVRLVLHQFYYPGWEARWQGGTLAARPESALGLAAFDLPPGSGTLTVRLAYTPAQWRGTWLSIAAALAAALLAARGAGLGRRPRPAGALSPAGRRGRPAGVLALVACLAALSALLVAALLAPNGFMRAPAAVNADLAGTVSLLAARVDRERYRAGEAVEITLYWRALRGLDRDYKAFVHLTDAALTRQPAQHDGDPGGGFTPVSRWLPGEVLPDTHHVPLPTDLAPGRYLLWAGMYEFETVRNLEVLSSDAPSQDDRVLVGEIEVVSR